MSLRAKILLYLLMLHAVLGAVAVLLLVEDRRWLLAVEALFVLSAVLGFLLVRAFFVPLDLIRTGAELINEQDFTSRFLPVGQPEMDDLVRVYNLMIDRLREERLRLEEQHLFLQSVLDASPSGLMTLDFDGRVSFVNPAADRLLGAGTAPVGSLLEDSESTVCAGMAAIPAGGTRVLALEGGRRLRITRGSFLKSGFPRGFYLLEEMTEELRASERSAYHKLIRMMSHEVNNSVGSVCSLIDSCRTYAVQISDQDREDFVQAMEIATGRMRNLDAFMSGFADVVRLPPPDRRPCDLRALLDDIRVLLGPEMGRRRIDCVWEAEVAVAPVTLDKNQMEQVLVNVLRNAMEAIGEEGRITLSLAESQGQRELRVSDNGGGLPEGAQEALFTPFFSTKRDGRGVGLTLVREILSRHRFDFGLRNARGGGGAEFWVRFPVD